MIFGLTWEKLLLIGLLAAVIIGPERLPRMAESFARIVHRGGQYLRGARDRMREEMGRRSTRSTGASSIRVSTIRGGSSAMRSSRSRPSRRPAPGRCCRCRRCGSRIRAGAAERMSKHAVPRGPQEFSAEEPPPYDDEAT
ncbi:Sec-independent protein translocase TatB [Microbacterium sp. NIBRBAC000506063]|uniref:Sec-independent protein translocase TatB n=1 Tax=Microbacterium sp. NIBRBAC000506063 TaxID=2734618 RepID=UPI001CB71ED7|nr:Sec-independent protein translocase TatB [Microbacterium sp. NIBRBAC000506063]